MMQKFRFLHPLSSPLFVTECRAIEFCSDIYHAFGRTIMDVSTIDGALVVTVDHDIPEADGQGALPCFELSYYGLERV